jgi:hypothetical protein
MPVTVEVYSIALLEKPALIANTNVHNEKQSYTRRPFGLETK